MAVRIETFGAFRAVSGDARRDFCSDRVAKQLQAERRNAAEFVSVAPTITFEAWVSCDEQLQQLRGVVEKTFEAIA